MNRSKALQLLGLTGNPSKDDVKKAYRKLAMKYHPDRVDEKDKAEAEEKFKEVKDAFEYLDNSKNDPIDVDFSSMFGTRGFSAKENFDWQKEMDEVANKHRARQEKAARNRHYRVGVKISLKEAFTGCSKKVDLTQIAGHIESITIQPGLKPGVKIRTIAGKYNEMDYTIDLIVDIDEADATVVWPEELWLHGGAKQGSGNITQTFFVDWITIMTGGFKSAFIIDGSTISVRIPAGIEAGKLLKVKGKGYWSDAKQSNRGDLLLRVLPVIPKIGDVDPEHVKQFIEQTSYMQSSNEPKID